jgi:hypothetical protein
LRYCELVGGCPADRHPSLSTSDDNERAWEQAKVACPGNLAQASRLLAEAKDAATTMVAEEWARIERLAVALCSSPGRILKSRSLKELLEEVVTDDSCGC